MNNLAIETPEVKINLDQEALLNFLDHTVLLITQARDANDVDLLMDDFMSTDVLQIFAENHKLFSLLNAVWFSTFKRIFIDEKSESFPLKVLWLPILFKQLGWIIEDIETFENANFKFRTEHTDKNDLYFMLVELFLHGLKFEPGVAFNLFKQKITSLSISESDKAKIDTMLSDIEDLGWGS